MSSRTVIESPQTTEIKKMLERLRAAPPLAFAAPESRHRSKTWDISPMFHCSIIGTCLTASQLRHFFAKLGLPDAKTASDHDLHTRGVHIAGKHDDAAKMLNKTIDKRHETAIKRFAKAAAAAQLRHLWREALEAGDIPGAYWAVLTHPAADRTLIHEVFGEVHMLSHLVGSSNRLDIARLRKLETALEESTAKSARQEVRLQAVSEERSGLLRKIDELQLATGKLAAREKAASLALAGVAPAATLQSRLDAEIGHSILTLSRLKETEERLRLAEIQIAELTTQNCGLRRERAALEGALGIENAGNNDAGHSGQDLKGLMLLYVGGRPKLAGQLKAITQRRGGGLLWHDGGIEDNPALLPGLASQADAALFPMDCISHMAAGKVKKICRDVGKPFIPLRTASVASFMAAIESLDIIQHVQGETAP